MPRRTNGEGSLTERPNGGWQGRLRLPDGDRRSFSGKTRSDVVKKMAVANRQAQQGIPVPKERLTVAEFLATWLANGQHRLKPKTWQRYKEIVELHLVPEFKGTALARLTATQVEALYTKKLHAGLSTTTVHHLHTVLHTALENALRKGLVAYNVTERADAPSIRHHEMQTLSDEQVNTQFFPALVGERLEALYVLAVTTGMRQGELLGLHWPDVDLVGAEPSVQVRYNLVNVRGKLTMATTKTDGSRRTVLLTDRAVAALHAHRARQLEERLAIGEYWDQASTLVFCTHLGGPLDASHILHRSFFALLAKAGLPRIRFHDLRHTCATIAIAKGAPIKAVSEMLGHKDVTTTLRIYAHVTPGMQQQTVATLNAVFRR